MIFAAGCTSAFAIIGESSPARPLGALRFSLMFAIDGVVGPPGVGTDAGVSVSERLPWPALPPVDTVPGGGGAPPEPA